MSEYIISTYKILFLYTRFSLNNKKKKKSANESEHLKINEFRLTENKLYNFFNS